MARRGESPFSCFFSILSKRIRLFSTYPQGSGGPSTVVFGPLPASGPLAHPPHPRPGRQHLSPYSPALNGTTAAAARPHTAAVVVPRRAPLCTVLSEAGHQGFRTCRFFPRHSIPIRSSGHAKHPMRSHGSSMPNPQARTGCLSHRSSAKALRVINQNITCFGAGRLLRWGQPPDPNHRPCTLLSAVFIYTEE
jgi:hypothetical protein